MRNKFLQWNYKWNTKYGDILSGRNMAGWNKKLKALWKRWAGIYELLDRQGVVDNLDLLSTEQSTRSRFREGRQGSGREWGFEGVGFAAGHPRVWNQCLPEATPERFRLPIALVLKHPVSIRPIRVKTPQPPIPVGWLVEFFFFYFTYSFQQLSHWEFAAHCWGRSIFFRFVRYILFRISGKKFMY